MTQVSIRLPTDLEAQLEDKRAALSALVGFTITRTDAILVLLRSALAEPTAQAVGLQGQPAKGRKK